MNVNDQRPNVRVLISKLYFMKNERDTLVGIVYHHQQTFNKILYYCEIIAQGELKQFYE